MVLIQDRKYVHYYDGVSLLTYEKTYDSLRVKPNQLPTELGYISDREK